MCLLAAVLEGNTSYKCRTFNHAVPFPVPDSTPISIALFSLLSLLEFEQSLCGAFGLLVFWNRSLTCPRVILKSWSCLHLPRARILEVLLPRCPISWLMLYQGARQHSPLSCIPSPIYIRGYVFTIAKYLSCPQLAKPLENFGLVLSISSNFFFTLILFLDSTPQIRHHCCLQTLKLQLLTGCSGTLIIPVLSVSLRPPDLHSEF